MQVNSYVNNRYELKRLLGKGGAGEVWLARDLMIERQVALKSLSPEHATNPELVQRFQREAKDAGRFSHSSIVQIYDVARVESTNLPFIVMELLPGGALTEWLVGKPPLPALYAAFRDIARGAAAIHAQGLVHRDLKPRNLLRSEEGLVKIADFGIAFRQGRPRMTREGFGVGTADYVAPEQIRGAAVTPASDIYSLGVILFEMLAGHLPFTGTEDAVLHAHLTQPAPDVRTLNPAVPDAVADLVARMLVKEPSKRFPQDGAGLVTAWRDATRPARTGGTGPTRAWSIPNPVGSSEAVTRLLGAAVASGQATLQQAGREGRQVWQWLGVQRRGLASGGARVVQAARTGRLRGELRGVRHHAERMVVGSVEGFFLGGLAGGVAGAGGGVTGALLNTALRGQLTSLLQGGASEPLGPVSLALAGQALGWGVGGALLGAALGAVLGVAAGLLLLARRKSVPSLTRRLVVMPLAALAWLVWGMVAGVGFRFFALMLGLFLLLLGRHTVLAFSAPLAEELLLYAAFGAIGWALFRTVDAALGEPTRTLPPTLLASGILGAVQGAFCLASGAVVYGTLQELSGQPLDQLISPILSNDIQLLARFTAATPQLIIGGTVGLLSGILAGKRKA